MYFMAYAAVAKLPHSPFPTDFLCYITSLNQHHMHLLCIATKSYTSRVVSNATTWALHKYSFFFHEIFLQNFAIHQRLNPEVM